MAGIFGKFASEKTEFEATSTYGDIKVDDNRKLFKMLGKIYPFSDLVSFELLEDGKVITEGGVDLGRAAVGGALFGTTGAGLGGFSKLKKEDREFCTSMKILVTLRNQKHGTIIIPYILAKSDKSKAVYSAAKANSKATLNGLNHIVEMTTDKTIQSYDDLIRLKELLDLGILTEEEFLKKKNQILGNKD